MGKRKSSEKDENYLKKKIQKLEKKLLKLKETPVPAGARASETEIEPGSPQRQTEDQTAEELSEELLLALGNEGEDISEVGQPILPELALRWKRILNCGLGTESKGLITKKYPSPENFSSVAPAMNPEIRVTMSETQINRDNRIIARQNTAGKAINCLGKALTCVLKGNINTKDLVEQISDGAKLIAEIFFQDSYTRKFFALSGANQVVRKAIAQEQSDSLLFGENCAEKIKAAHMTEKTGLQIKPVDTNNKSKPRRKNNNPKTQGNWRGPSRNPQKANRRGRGGHYQPPRRASNQPYQPQRKRGYQFKSRGSNRR